jgi:transposase, IS4 family
LVAHRFPLATPHPRRSGLTCPDPDETLARLAAWSGVGATTAWRYVREAVEGTQPGDNGILYMVRCFREHFVIPAGWIGYHLWFLPSPPDGYGGSPTHR